MDKMLVKAMLLAELLIIKRDFDLLSKIATHLKPEFQIQLLPYTALYCYEALEYLTNSGNPVSIEQTSRYSIKDIRQKAKFFDLSINKLLQSVKNVNKLQNEYFVGIMKYPKFGRWNIHNNIGIWFDSDKRIVGNTQLAYYVFQDEKMISQRSDIMHGHELQEEEIRNFAFDMGRIIGSISSALSDIGDYIKGDFTISNIEIYSQDYNTNRCKFFDNGEYKILSLFLLHVVSNIGFIVYVLKKCIIKDTGILLRMEYITYYYTLRRLEGIINYLTTKQNAIIDNNLCDALNSIDFKSSKGLLRSEFRNCMMHFGLHSNDNMPLIKESKFDLSIPLCGLVESQFSMDYITYQRKIELELVSIHKTLNHYLRLP